MGRWTASAALLVLVGGTLAAVPAVEPELRHAPVAAVRVAAAVETLTRSVPVRLQIKAIDVDTSLVPLGLRTDGSLQVPAGAYPAGWWSGGATPGERGAAVVVGHVDWQGPGVFVRLREMVAGDVVRVTRQDGAVATFRVTRTQRVAKTAFPTSAVYGPLDHAGLRLVTCGGEFDAAARSYRDNLIVFADLVPDSTQAT